MAHKQSHRQVGLAYLQTEIQNTKFVEFLSNFNANPPCMNVKPHAQAQSTPIDHFPATVLGPSAPLATPMME